MPRILQEQWTTRREPGYVEIQIERKSRINREHFCNSLPCRCLPSQSSSDDLGEDVPWTTERVVLEMSQNARNERTLFLDSTVLTYQLNVK